MSVVVTWSMLAIIGITISFLLSALVYMLSHIFSSEMMSAWSKHEIQTALLTIILFVSLTSLANMQFVKEYTAGAKNYLSNLYNDAIFCQVSLYSSGSGLAMISSITFSINPTIASIKNAFNVFLNPQTQSGDEKKSNEGGRQNWSVGISPASFMQPVLIALSDIQSYLFIPFTTLQFHLQLFTFIFNKGATMILPLGIFLRAFKFSRHGGNLLIALFISLYFILPAMYLFGDSLMQSKFNTTQHMCENYKPSLVSEFGTPLLAKAGLGGPESFGDNWDGDFAKIILPESSKDLIFNGKSSFTTVFLRMIVECTILPMFAIIVSLGLAREFALLLGSDIDFSQLVRVV